MSDEHDINADDESILTLTQLKTLHRQAKSAKRLRDENVQLRETIGYFKSTVKELTEQAKDSNKLRIEQETQICSLKQDVLFAEGACEELMRKQKALEQQVKELTESRSFQNPEEKESLLVYVRRSLKMIDYAIHKALCPVDDPIIREKLITLNEERKKIKVAN